MTTGERPEPAPERPAARATAGELIRQRRVQLAALVVLAAAAVLAGWALSREDEPSPAGPAEQRRSVEPIPPVGLSEDGLRTLATEMGQPVYWAGGQAGHVYELTRTAEGNVYVRYLPEGVDVGAEGSDFLVIATYPFADAVGALRRIGEGRELDVPGGGIAVVNERTAQSVYLAWPEVRYQVEVYDPSPERALELARSGAVRPVG